MLDQLLPVTVFPNRFRTCIEIMYLMSSSLKGVETRESLWLGWIGFV